MESTVFMEANFYSTTVVSAIRNRSTGLELISTNFIRYLISQPVRLGYHSFRKCIFPFLVFFQNFPVRHTTKVLLCFAVEHNWFCYKTSYALQWNIKTRPETSRLLVNNFDSTVFKFVNYFHGHQIVCYTQQTWRQKLSTNSTVETWESVVPVVFSICLLKLSLLQMSIFIIRQLNFFTHSYSWMFSCNLKRFDVL